LWATPFLIYDLVENNFKHLFLTVTIFACWLIITFLFEPSLSYGLFNPLWPDLERSPGLSSFVSQYTDVFQIKSLIRSVFAGASTALIYLVFSRYKKSQG
jgi:hypothetical protein